MSSRRAPFPKAAELPVVRPPEGQRRFRSQTVEEAIAEFGRHAPDPALAWLYGNCLARPLDLTVRLGRAGGQLDTFVESDTPGVLDLTDSTLQLWPYLRLAPYEARLRELLAGLIRRQTRCLLLDPYANAFYDDPTRRSADTSTQPPPAPGVHTRQWALESLCYPLRLAYHYWKVTGDQQPFGADWRQALAAVVRTLREQQKTGPGPYRYQHLTNDALATRPLGGAGYPVRPCGLIAVAFGPGGEATRLGFPVAANFLAVVSLRQAALMLNDIYHDDAGYADLMKLADEVAVALRQHAVVPHPTLGSVYAAEVDGYGGYTLPATAGAASLLTLPYLDALPRTDPVYQATRHLAFSPGNPYFYQGRTAEGLGSPRTEPGAIWPLALAQRGLTSSDPIEARRCVEQLLAAQAGTGYLPLAFDPNAAGPPSYPSSAAACALGAELLWQAARLS